MKDPVDKVTTDVIEALTDEADELAQKHSARTADTVDDEARNAWVDKLIAMLHATALGQKTVCAACAIGYGISVYQLLGRCAQDTQECEAAGNHEGAEAAAERLIGCSRFIWQLAEQFCESQAHKLYDKPSVEGTQFGEELLKAFQQIDPNATMGVFKVEPRPGETVEELARRVASEVERKGEKVN